MLFMMIVMITTILSRQKMTERERIRFRQRAGDERIHRSFREYRVGQGINEVL